jgi:5-methyltetrahydropteroyltriglutamate--homocysteine methyltransferase
MGAPIYRAETVGSLLRPDYLRQAREAHAAGELPAAPFKRIEDRAVDEAIALQEAAGLEVVTDGEMRRGHFTGSLSEAITGLGEVPAETIQWHAGTPEDEMEFRHRTAVTGKLERYRSLAQEEFVYLRARASRPVKVTLPSPLMMQTFWSTTHSTDAYADPFEMFADGAEILRREVRELVALGCEYIQVDAPELATLVDESVREAFHERGIDPERMLGEGLEILGSVAEEPGPRYALHLCRGNRAGHWMAEGGYEAISREVFRRAPRFGTFFLEYDDPRSGGFEPLADVPDDKFVVLGLVSTKRAELERPEELLARIDEAARHFPREQLALSPQCGFASAMNGNPVPPETQGAKFRLVSEVAATAWPPSDRAGSRSG